MNYYLGIDIGTTSTKAVAFSETGEEINICSIGYDMSHPEQGWSEQNPTEIFEAVIKTINQTLEDLNGKAPALISFSAAMHSFLAVDINGKAITPLIIWADNRAGNIGDNLRNSDIGKSFYKATGVPIHAMSPLCKLVWLKENQQETFDSAFKFIGIKEYVFCKLFGGYYVDSSVASATGLLNINTLNWDEKILQYLGFPIEKLSTVVSPKQCYYLSESHDYLPGLTSVPFVIGASDGALANVGTGAIENNKLAVTIGTSGAARIITNKPILDNEMRTFCYHLKDEQFIVGGANNNGAVVLQWLQESFLRTDESIEEMIQLANEIKPGSQGLLFLPYVLGERAPIWNAKASGCFFGLTVNHTKAHVIRSAIEGVLFSLYSIAEIIFEDHKVDTIYASGGFAKSEIVLQMIADIFNKKVVVSATVESSALGAVVLGAEALNIPFKRKNEEISVHYPIEENSLTYQFAFKKFKRLYLLLKDEM